MSSPLIACVQQTLEITHAQNTRTHNYPSTHADTNIQQIRHTHTNSLSLSLSLSVSTRTRTHTHSHTYSSTHILTHTHQAYKHAPREEGVRNNAAHAHADSLEGSSHLGGQSLSHQTAQTGINQTHIHLLHTYTHMRCTHSNMYTDAHKHANTRFM